MRAGTGWSGPIFLVLVFFLGASIARENKEARAFLESRLTKSYSSSVLREADWWGLGETLVEDDELTLHASLVYLKNEAFIGAGISNRSKRPICIRMKSFPDKDFRRIYRRTESARVGPGEFLPLLIVEGVQGVRYLEAARQEVSISLSGMLSTAFFTWTPNAEASREESCRSAPRELAVWAEAGDLKNSFEARRIADEKSQMSARAHLESWLSNFVPAEMIGKYDWNEAEQQLGEGIVAGIAATEDATGLVLIGVTLQRTTGKRVCVRLKLPREKGVEFAHGILSAARGG